MMRLSWSSASVLSDDSDAARPFGEAASLLGRLELARSRSGRRFWPLERTPPKIIIVSYDFFSMLRFFGMLQ